jgi:hypothetical protein
VNKKKKKREQAKRQGEVIRDHIERNGSPPNWAYKRTTTKKKR